MKLELRNLSKSFTGQRVLENLNYQSAACQALALIGPSGGGKSTLLRLIAGLIVPDSGEIHLDSGTLQHSEAALLQHRRSIGVVFQAYNLFPHLSALDNILLPLEKVHGCDPGAARTRAAELLEKFKLKEHAMKKPAALSGGQRQRIAIIRALAHRPRLLLFDEPTSALDPEMSAEVLSAIETLKGEGTDFILVTHHMAFARRVADQALFLAGGRIVEAGGSPAFFESPSTTLLRDFLNKHLLY